MPAPLISVENLSKAYRIGVDDDRPDTLAGAFASWFKAPVRNFKRLAQLDVARKVQSPIDADVPLRAEGWSSESGADSRSKPTDVFWALREVSFSVQQGDVLGIIGRNGAGKSTLLKILSRITEPSFGRAVIRGRVSSLLEVGTGFHPELTGRDNIYMNGTILGMTKREIDRKFDEIVEFSGVEVFLDTPTKHYSSGMVVRLAFAVAAHLEPEILIIDEVLAVGDARFQKKCLGKMSDIASGGRTVLFVSHNMPAITSLCSKVAVFESGRLVAAGDPTDMVHRYLSSQEAANRRLLNGNINRRGSGLVRFVEWSLYDDELGLGDKVRSNQPCEFRVKYQIPGDREVRNVEFALTIKDFFGQRIMTAATRFVNADFDRLPRTGTVVCRLDRVPLVPETYHVHLWCAANGECADLLEDAGQFEVSSFDVFGTGRGPERKHGLTIVPHTWTLE